VIQSAEEFARLRRSEDPVEYHRAATEEAPLEVWLAVVTQFPALREWVAENKTIPLSVLEQLASDPNPRVRATVAGKRKLSVQLQRALAQDQEPSVRERLANNAKCEVEILRVLSRDPEGFVRAAATNKLERRSAL